MTCEVGQLNTWSLTSWHVKFGILTGHLLWTAPLPPKSNKSNKCNTCFWEKRSGYILFIILTNNVICNILYIRNGICLVFACCFCCFCWLWSHTNPQKCKNRPFHRKIRTSSQSACQGNCNKSCATFMKILSVFLCYMRK